LNYDYTHLGSTPQTLAQLASGDHPFSARLNQAELPMIIVSSEVFNRSDSNGIKEALN